MHKQYGDAIKNMYDRAVTSVRTIQEEASIFPVQLVYILGYFESISICFSYRWSC